MSDGTERRLVGLDQSLPAAFLFDLTLLPFHHCFLVCVVSAGFLWGLSADAVDEIQTGQKKRFLDIKRPGPRRLQTKF